LPSYFSGVVLARRATRRPDFWPHISPAPLLRRSVATRNEKRGEARFLARANNLAFLSATRAAPWPGRGDAQPVASSASATARNNGFDAKRKLRARGAARVQWICSQRVFDTEDRFFRKLLSCFSEGRVIANGLREQCDTQCPARDWRTHKQVYDRRRDAIFS
jgi:hypothetical protein